MKRLSWLATLVIPVALCLIVVFGCRASDSSGTNVESAPPDVKKGAVIQASVTALSIVGVIGYGNGVVEEVRGNWVKLKYSPKHGSYPEFSAWVNFGKLGFYRVVRDE